MGGLPTRRFLCAALLVLVAALLTLVAAPPLGAQARSEKPGFGGITAQTLPLSEDLAPILVCRLVRAGDGRPVSGAQVVLQGSTIGAVSDEQGSVELAVPGAGRWMLVTRLIGYRGERLELDLARATVTQVLVGLRRDGSAVRDSLYLAPPPRKPASH